MVNHARQPVTMYPSWSTICVVPALLLKNSVNMVLEAALNHTGLGPLVDLRCCCLYSACMYPLALQLSLYCAHSLRLSGDRVTLEYTARGCVVNLLFFHFIVL